MCGLKVSSWLVLKGHLHRSFITLCLNPSRNFDMWNHQNKILASLGQQELSIFRSKSSHNILKTFCADHERGKRRSQRILDRLAFGLHMIPADRADDVGVCRLILWTDGVFLLNFSYKPLFSAFVSIQNELRYVELQVWICCLNPCGCGRTERFPWGL